MKRLLERLEEKIVIDDDPLPSEPIDVIIGCGVGLAPDRKTISGASMANVRMALNLACGGITQNILFTGNCPPYRKVFISEAECMKEAAAKLLPKDCKVRFFTEPNSKYSVENARFSIRIMQEKGWKSAIVITQQLTARRVRRIWRKAAEGTEIRIYVTKAWSPYGGNYLWRWDAFPLALFWESLGFAVAKISGQL